MAAAGSNPQSLSVPGAQHAAQAAAAGNPGLGQRKAEARRVREDSAAPPRDAGRTQARNLG